MVVVSIVVMCVVVVTAWITDLSCSSNSMSCSSICRSNNVCVVVVAA